MTFGMNLLPQKYIDKTINSLQGNVVMGISIQYANMEIFA